MVGGHNITQEELERINHMEIRPHPIDVESEPLGKGLCRRRKRGGTHRTIAPNVEPFTLEQQGRIVHMMSDAVTQAVQAAMANIT